MNHMDLENQILAWLESHPKRNRRIEDIVEGLGQDDLAVRQVLDQMEQNYEGRPGARHGAEGNGSQCY